MSTREPLTIRDARPADAAALAQVHVRAWQVGYAHVFGEERLAALSLEERTTRWTAQLSNPRRGVRTFVAERDGKLTGFSAAGPSRDRGPDAASAELYALYVDPAAWGGGTAVALHDAALAVLAGYPDATLWVLEDNPRARRFYEREGWRLDGARRHGEHLGVRTVEIRYRRRSEDDS